MPTTPTALSNIQHVIVLMFENRSFDHILGGMPGVNGMLQNDPTVLYNCPDPLQQSTGSGGSNPATTPFPIRPALNQNSSFQNIPSETDYNLDGNHDFGNGMLQEIFGPGTTGFIQGQPTNAPEVTYPASNSGFLYSLQGQSSGQLSYFAWPSMQVLHTLANAFVVCDAWHCDMPGHTAPNRAFMHCATTGDLGIDDTDDTNPVNPNQWMNLGLWVNRRTIFEQIQEAGRSWKMYWPGLNCDTDWLNEQVFSQVWDPNNPTNNVTQVPIGLFFQDLQDDTLPFYSFIMCWNDLSVDTSMHPATTVEAGEELLACIYSALYQSPCWGNTLLIVNFDENGGIYDHASMGDTILPVTQAPELLQTNQNPPVWTWTAGSQTYSFDFTALGVRIPVLLISPWLNAGICSTQYQNTSILRFVQDMLGPIFGTPYYLTQRDLNAPSFAPVFEYSQFGSQQMRTNCPNPGDLQTYGLGICAAMQGDTRLLTAEQLAAPLPPHLAQITKRYIVGLPGHSDSGKPINRNFATVGEMRAYAKERRDAALAYIKAKKGKK
jgi:phospholipase C